MKTRQFLVTYTSYTTSDENLYNEVKVFSGADYQKNEQDARQVFERLKKNAYEECKWGEYWNADPAEREADGVKEHNPLYSCCDISRANYDQMLHGTYEVESEVYEGYKVSIRIDEQEVETPCGDIFLFDRRYFTEEQAKNMTKTDAMALAQVEKDLRHVWHYKPYTSTFESDWNGYSIDPAKYLIRIIY